MSPTVVHICGPKGSGKTTLARIMASRQAERNSHYLRFEVQDAGDAPLLRTSMSIREMVSCAVCRFSPRSIFEQVPEQLSRIADEDPDAVVLVESEAQSHFHYAYPYDVKVFVMPCPTRLNEVFRTPDQAAEAIDRAMDDTTVFASEMFGLVPDPHDSSVLLPLEPGEQTKRRIPVQEVDEFLDSDVGIEITSRMRFQSRYQAIVDSDVILINEGVGQPGSVAQQCEARVSAVLDNLRRRLGRENWLALCDPLDPEDPLGQEALERIESLIEAARAGPHD